MRRITIFFLVTISLLAIQLNAQQIPSPEQFFGFKMGTDGKLARWDKIVKYFKMLDEQSDKLIVQNLGESTLDNPFILKPKNCSGEGICWAFNYYLNNAVYLMEEFLESTTDPYYEGEVDYGDRAEHCWNGDHTQPNAISRLRYHQMYAPKIVERILKTAPPGGDISSWRY